jgi:hypothetical protein
MKNGELLRHSSPFSILLISLATCTLPIHIPITGILYRFFMSRMRFSFVVANPVRMNQIANHQTLIGKSFVIAKLFVFSSSTSLKHGTTI